MNDTLNTISKRRSTRAFSSKEISNEDFEAIAESAYKAPSGMNKQTWKFIAIKNKEVIAKLAKAVGTALGRSPDYNFYGPDAFIICANDKESRFAVPDCACALQNIFLAAQSLGIDSVWINQLNDCYDDPQVRSMLTEFGLPENYGVYGCAALGYKAEGQPVEPTAKDASVLTYIR